MTFSSKFALRDRVWIDGDDTINATVVGFAFYGQTTEVQISWVHAGAIQTAWVAEWRLTHAEG
jgi:hypothetical protein